MELRSILVSNFLLTLTPPLAFIGTEGVMAISPAGVGPIRVEGRRAPMPPPVRGADIVRGGACADTDEGGKQTQCSQGCSTNTFVIV